MKIYKQGETGEAICRQCEKRVQTTYEYRTVHLEETGVDVENVLVGVCQECGEIASVPAQSTPRFREAREAKLATVNARIPRHLDDILHVVASEYGASTEAFSSAMFRYYLHEVAKSEQFARRVCRLAGKDLASGKAETRVSLRLSEHLWSDAWREAKHVGITTRTALLKGLIIAAMEDSVGGRAPARKRVLEGIATVA